MAQPNLFRYGGGELSQDALICWLVACAGRASGNLRECGLAFVRTLFRAGASDRACVPVLGPDGKRMVSYDGPCVITNVRCPQPQYQKIDVYFQAEVDGQTVTFVVEDKTDTEVHGEQLARHLEVVVGDDEEEDLIKPIYYKTGYVFSNEREAVEQEGFSVFQVQDMADFLDGQSATQENEILRQYAEYLAVYLLEPRITALRGWDFRQAHVQWEFMVELRDSLTGASDEWGHSIPDELSDSPPDDWLWRGLGRAKNNGGRPFTQYWFAKHLFWRLDSGMPMRLMIYLPNAGGGLEKSDVHGYRDRFNDILSGEGLRTGSVRLKIGKECTIGSVELDGLQGVGVNEFLDRVMRVHVKFLEAMSRS